MKVPQLQVIDEVAKVPRSRQRQVPMIQEMQQDQKPEEVQISKSVKKRAPHFVLTSKAGRTKRKCRKTKRQSTGVQPSTTHFERGCRQRDSLSTVVNGSR